ncbi:hypothetical protein C8A03DRAFT_44564 [Achaetomium macrosporum]|uniref:Uncharacterized protein n=1 Tax=Achaetomium macrosporum TaxID=79813 RepID=A0AAN7HDK2_9PEZI|nr:hypothetical protein C8A03DRAFT_44564 [Achaetomium macrosporum]
MRSSNKVLAALLGTAFARPSPADSGDPIRILPYSWQYEITALEGPGCPDFNSMEAYSTRPTFGSNTVDGSEIYYWHFAYPHIHLTVDGDNTPEASIWCETTLKYVELTKTGAPPEVPGYRLRLHKNGTSMIADYGLDEGVEATWTFTYDTDGKGKITDTITVSGPRAPGTYTDISPSASPAGKTVQYPLPECGVGTIKYRTELTVKATKKGAKGTVASEGVERDGRAQFYGIQQGVSYDWERCAA